MTLKGGREQGAIRPAPDLHMSVKATAGDSCPIRAEPEMMASVFVLAEPLQFRAGGKVPHPDHPLAVGDYELLVAGGELDAPGGRRACVSRFWLLLAVFDIPNSHLAVHCTAGIALAVGGEAAAKSSFGMPGQKANDGTGFGVEEYNPGAEANRQQSAVRASNRPVGGIFGEKPERSVAEEADEFGHRIEQVAAKPRLRPLGHVFATLVVQRIGQLGQFFRSQRRPRLPRLRCRDLFRRRVGRLAWFFPRELPRGDGNADNCQRRDDRSHPSSAPDATPGSEPTERRVRPRTGLHLVQSATQETHYFLSRGKTSSWVLLM